jgi:microcystin-dependent protein
MDSPYLGQVFMFAWDFAAKNYQLAAGQLLGINQNQALFSILGTTYGGDGRTTFALPDLRGRSYLGTGQGPGLSDYTIGEQVGTQSVTLLQPNLPIHNHSFNVNNGVATVGTPTGAVLSQGPVPLGGTTVATYTTAAFNATLNPGALAATGNNQPDPLLQPYLCINFSVCVSGLFPSRN